MNGEKQARRAIKLSNWMLAIALALVALTAYGLIALRIHVHGVN
jgi:hypothetical protein